MFTWVGGVNDNAEKARMLVAFRDTHERDQFLKYVQLPKQSTYALGSLDRL